MICNRKMKEAPQRKVAAALEEVRNERGMKKCLRMHGFRV